MNRKAMSPLFSTIILIGFAIALGGVVMSWGKGGYTPEKEIIGCERTSLSLISYGENKGICDKEGKLFFTIQNNGEADLDGIKIAVLGREDIYSDIISKEMSSADVVKSEISHPDIGKIEKVIFTPVFIYLDKERLCPKNGFSIENVGEC